MIKLVAEIGINHNGSLGIAKKLIDIASFAGFDYVKFQKRTPDLCVPENKKNEIRKTPWGEITYLEYRKKLEFEEYQYQEINRYCNEKNIKWFASVWDLHAAKIMKKFLSIIKIPSAMITDIELLKYCRDNYQTIIISTGMSTEEEIKTAIEIAKPNIIFHTNSVYPSNIQEINLNYIKWLQKKYPDIEIGYSGHEYGLTISYAAIAIGITWLERHITLDHDMWGSDQKASIDPVGIIKIVRGIRDIEKAMGEIAPRKLLESEKAKQKDLRK